MRTHWQSGLEDKDEEEKIEARNGSTALEMGRRIFGAPAELNNPETIRRLGRAR